MLLLFQKDFWGAPGWLSQLSVQLLTLVQVMISQLMSWSPASVSVLTAQNPEPLRILSPSLSAPPPLMLCLSLSPWKINNYFFNVKTISSSQFCIIYKTISRLHLAYGKDLATGHSLLTLTLDYNFGITFSKLEIWLLVGWNLAISYRYMGCLHISLRQE